MFSLKHMMLHVTLSLCLLGLYLYCFKGTGFIRRFVSKADSPADWDILDI